MSSLEIGESTKTLAPKKNKKDKTLKQPPTKAKIYTKLVVFASLLILSFILSRLR